MVAVFALIGLIGGILAGLFNPSGAQRSPGQDVSDRSAQAPSSSATALPKSFYTVIVASVAISQSRSVANARAKAIRESGVEDVGVLDSSRYRSLSAKYWAVYSGVFSTWQEAKDHRDQIRAAHPDLGNCYAKQVTNQP
jgi:SPOR domain